MESSGTPPPPDQPGEDDPPLPTWYKPPTPPGEPPSEELGRPPGAAEPRPFTFEPIREPEPGEMPAEPDDAGAQEPPSWAPPPAPPGPVFERPAAASPSAPASTPVAPTGDAAPLGAAGVAGAAAAEELPPWSRVRDIPADAPPERPVAPPPATLPPAAVADAWTTEPKANAVPRWAAPSRRDHPHVFGDRMAAGVLLTLAAGSMVGGGVYALLIGGSDIDATIRAVICGVVALVLLAGSVAMRLLRGTEDLRGTLAVTGIAFAAACLAFAYNPDTADAHATLVKFALGAGLVTVLAWVAAVVVPSAVAGLIGVVGLGTAVGAGIWLLVDQPTNVEVFVGALGIGIAVALVLPRLALLRPHPAGLGWALGGVAVVMTLPAIVLIARNDTIALAAGATASAALLALAQQHRNLPAAVGAFAGLAYLELVLVVTRTGATGGTPQGTQLIIVAGVGAALAVLVTLVAMLRGRARPVTLSRRRLPVGVADLLLVAALALAVISLFTGNRDVLLNPTQLQPTQTATQAPAAAQL